MLRRILTTAILAGGLALGSQAQATPTFSATIVLESAPKVRVVHQGGPHRYGYRHHKPWRYGWRHHYRKHAPKWHGRRNHGRQFHHRRASHHKVQPRRVHQRHIHRHHHRRH